MENVTYNGLTFHPFIKREAIQTRVGQIASAISEDYEGKLPILICVLNGAFSFASDLFMNLSIDAEITFIRLKSYSGTDSTGEVSELIGLSEDIRGRDVIVIEDIIDTGKTIKILVDDLKRRQPSSVKIASLLFKPEACRHEVTPDYIGFTIPTKFIIGYGLDIDGLARNLPDIWVTDDAE